VCFGGNRGSLSGRLPPVDKATILKKKVMDIWKWIETNSTTDNTLSQDLVQLGVRQFEEYKKMDAEVEASKDKLKKKHETLRASMVSYERQKGALPPGAKETDAGRANHSTNCAVGQPASFAYVHTESNGQPNATPATSKAKKRGPSPAPSSSGRSSSINSAAMEEVSGFNVAFQRLVDRLPNSNKAVQPIDEEFGLYDDLELDSPDKKKLDTLHRMRKRTLSRITSYKPFIETDDTARKEYTTRIAKLAKIDKKIEKIVGDDSLSLSDSSRTTLGK
jgi:hypothetical protein